MWNHSHFIFWYMAVQFSQHRLLKRLSFPHCIFLGPLLIINCICMSLVFGSQFWLLICVFMSTPYYFHVNTILFSFLRFCNTLWNHAMWCLQVCSSFSILLLLFECMCVSTSFRIICFISLKNITGILVGIALNL